MVSKNSSYKAQYDLDLFLILGSCFRVFSSFRGANISSCPILKNKICYLTPLQFPAADSQF
jgi:hypothetical protein